MPANSDTPATVPLMFEEWLRHSSFATRERRLREYVLHKASCQFNTDSCLREDCSHCDCGLAELLAAKEGEANA